MISILMVDNSESDFILTRAGFEHGGDFCHALDWADTIESGLSKVEHNTYDILIVDYKLNNDMTQTGLDFIHALREKTIGTPVILLTGMTTEKIPRAKCDSLNISRCVSKHETDPRLLICIILDTMLHFKKGL